MAETSCLQLKAADLLLTSAAAAVRQHQGSVFAARPLQLAGAVVAPPIGATHGLHLRPCADEPTVTVSVSNQPLQRQPGVTQEVSPFLLPLSTETL